MQPLIVEYNIDAFSEAMRQLANDIGECDLLIGIARGGAIPAVHLSHLINKPVYITNYSTRDQNWGLEPHLKHVVESKNIILVDDLIDSGKSILQMLEYLKTYANSIQVAVLLQNTDVEIGVPVFTARKFSRKTYPHWFQFFWEKQL